MVLKRNSGEEGSENSPLPNHPQSPPTKFRKVVNYVMKEVSLQEIASKISAILEPTLRKVVKEEVDALITSLQSSPRCSLVHQPNSCASRGLKLHLIGKLPSTLFTNSKIEDEGHASLQIMLVDSNSKNVIQHGPLSSTKVEILVLSGDFSANGREDWSESEFNGSVVHQREGKRPLLVGDCSFPLNNGIGFIGNVSFTDNSSWVRSRKFRLGVRAVSSASVGTGIREAVSEAFVVLDHRGESYQKHDTPSLDDPVWRLRKISKLGASHKKLESLGIKTVKDFLMHYHVNPSFLRDALGKGIAPRAWDTMVKHANECHLDDTRYPYHDAAEGVELLFNCVFKVIAVKFEREDYKSVDALNFHQKALVDKLKHLVYQNLMISIHNSSTVPALVPPNIEQNIPFSSPNLVLQRNDLSLIDQEEGDQRLDFNLSDSASYPCTVEDGYQLEDDSMSQSNPPMQGVPPAAFMMGDSSGEPPASGAGYNWYPKNCPISSFPSINQFGELFYPQTSPFFPHASTWDHGDGFLTSSSTTAAHVGILSELPNFGFNVSVSGKPKAGWSKIRAAVMWKIVRRKAAARRKAKLPYCYYECMSQP